MKEGVLHISFNICTEGVGDRNIVWWEVLHIALNMVLGKKMPFKSQMFEIHYLSLKDGNCIQWTGWPRCPAETVSIFMLFSGVCAVQRSPLHGQLAFIIC